MSGLEIAPWYAPIAPKAEGFNVRILDFFPKDELYRRAIADPNIPAGSEKDIEEVDFVGNASDIASLVTGKYDYLISSHNFEHLPDPIRFLQGSESLLEHNGRLIMALPDCRHTFDRYRPHTMTGEWIQAYKEARKKPTAQQIFEFYSRLGSNHDAKLTGDLIDSFNQWSRDYYVDVHCTLFFPASFELLMLEARALGLTNLEVVKITPQWGEFFVWLQMATSAIENLQERREQLMRRVKVEYSLPPSRSIQIELIVRTMLGKVIGLVKSP